jgi:hypothetical protein
MNNSIKILLSDKGIKYAIFLSTSILLLEIVSLIFFYKKFPPIIPLFNSLAWGRDRLAPSFIIFSVPAFLVVVHVMNVTSSAFFYKKHALLSRMIIVNLLLVVGISFVALGQILLLIF